MGRRTPKADVVVDREAPNRTRVDAVVVGHEEERVREDEHPRLLEQGVLAPRVARNENRIKIPNTRKPYWCNYLTPLEEQNSVVSFMVFSFSPCTTFSIKVLVGRIVTSNKLETERIATYEHSFCPQCQIPNL